MHKPKIRYITGIYIHRSTAININTVLSAIFDAAPAAHCRHSYRKSIFIVYQSTGDRNKPFQSVRCGLAAIGRLIESKLINK